MLLSYTLRNGENGQFYVIRFYHKKKQEGKITLRKNI